MEPSGSHKVTKLVAIRSTKINVEWKGTVEQCSMLAKVRKSREWFHSEVKIWYHQQLLGTLYLHYVY